MIDSPINLDPNLFSVQASRVVPFHLGLDFRILLWDVAE